MNMNRIEFLKNIFKLVGKDDVVLLKMYDKELATNKPVNWQKLYDLSLKDMEKKSLPMPNFFKAKLPYCYQYESNNMLGGTIRVIRKNDQFTDYIVCIGEALMDLDQVKNHFKGVGIKQILFYDKSVSFVGQTPYPTNAQPRILYQCG